MTNVLRTRVGACWPGTRAVFRGRDVHRDLADVGWMELYVLGITARRLAPPELRVLEGIWTMTSYPDTRLWNNRVAALAANARSASVLGLAAAIAATESGVFGGGPGLQAIDFFLRAGVLHGQGVPAEAIVERELQTRRILGYGRPLNATDERLPPLMRLVEREGLDQGLHYRLAFDVEQAMLRRKPFLKMNFAALTAALAADMGFTARQYQLYNILKTLAGMPPCILEAAEKPEGSLMPTLCDDVIYDGVGPRNWGDRNGNERSAQG